MELPRNEPENKIMIAVGRDRFSMAWRNTEMTWPELAARLKTTRRTSETAAEYAKMNKAARDKTKDVGGFVGGTVKSGIRKAENIGWRQVITLDADYAVPGFTDYVRAVLADKTWLLYSTHSHTAEKPRLRLVLPLSRAVNPDEYQAIARRVAADIGMDYFDDTTYQPHRLMYWPSTSDDGDFYSTDAAGAWLDADAQLARYEDWTDQSFWPVSSRMSDIIKKHAAKQQDPCAKRGIIGAFCRTYTVQEAIEKFIPGVYEACGKSDRYTYTEGSTSAGAIVYDDRFLYSHHSTDPCSEQLVNAFDLVRIHRFREEDDTAQPGTPPGRLPSYKAMQDLAREDAGVRQTLADERLAEVHEDFGDLGDPDWATHLKYDRMGNVLPSATNVKLILANDPNLKGKIALDEFTHRITLLGDLPWRQREKGQWWQNSDDSCLRNYLDEIYNITGKGIVDDALQEIIGRNSFHSVRDYLGGLEWDEIPRLDTLFIDYLGAEDTEFNRVASRKTLVAAVARVMEPGIKFDTVLTFIGKQGLGKSYIWKRLGKCWTSDSMHTLSGKEAMEQVQGFWIIELAELAALNRSELEAAKQFITKQDDSFRPAYGRETEHYLRQCVFVATTNVSDFIKDQTGGRRWWPMPVGVATASKDLFKDLTDAEVDQVWAEALYYYREKEPLYLERDLSAKAIALQRQHTEESSWTGPIGAYLDMQLPENWDSLGTAERREFLSGDGFDRDAGTVKRSRVCALEIWVELMGGDVKNLSRGQATEINNIIRNMDGWTQSKSGLRFGKYGYQKGFIRE